MTRDDFDTLTDWIGIPLAILLLVLLVAYDVLAIDRRRPRTVWVVAIVALAAFTVGLNAARFVTLA